MDCVRRTLFQKGKSVGKMSGVNLSDVVALYLAAICESPQRLLKF